MIDEDISNLHLQKQLQYIFKDNFVLKKIYISLFNRQKIILSNLYF